MGAASEACYVGQGGLYQPGLPLQRMVAPGMLPHQVGFESLPAGLRPEVIRTLQGMGLNSDFPVAGPTLPSAWDWAPEP